jgi:hypothetical protein
MLASIAVIRDGAPLGVGQCLLLCLSAFDLTALPIATVTWRQQQIAEKQKTLLSQFLFVHHKSLVDWPGIEQRLPQWEAGENPLSEVIIDC